MGFSNSHQRLATNEGPAIASEAENRKRSHYPDLPYFRALGNGMPWRNWRQQFEVHQRSIEKNCREYQRKAVKLLCQTKTQSTSPARKCCTSDRSYTSGLSTNIF